MKRIPQIFLTFLLVFATKKLHSQNEDSKLALGFGASIVKFSDSDKTMIGDSYMFQIPRGNLALYLGKGFTLDGSLSFNFIDDIGIVSNSQWYISWDLHGRYDFNTSNDNMVPYILAGGSLVNAGKITSYTYNFGAGFTYWYSQKWGINAQAVYKVSPSSIESMRSHPQISIGWVYSFNYRILTSNSERGRLWDKR